MNEAAVQRALARIDAGAIERNCARLAGELGGGAALCAVVKADGYGHGAAESARAALAGGATWLAVAAAAEAAGLREELPDARILTMGALTPDELDVALAAGSDVAVWRAEFLELVARARRGDRRAGARPPQVRLAAWAASATPIPRLSPRSSTPPPPTRASRPPGCGPTSRPRTIATRPISTTSCAASPRWPVPLKQKHPEMLLHAANSAATLRDPESALRHGALRRGDLRPRSRSRATPRTRASSPRWSCAPTSPTSSASSRARAPATGSAGRRPPTPGSACFRSATATASGGG